MIHEPLLPDDQPEPPADMLAAAAEYAKLANRLHAADGECEAIKQQMQKIEPLLLEAMALNGIDHLRAQGRTIYRKTNFYVSKRAAVGVQDVCDRLRQHGLDYLVKDGYNAASVKAKIREWLDDGEVPPLLKDCFNIGEAQTLATRSA